MRIQETDTILKESKLARKHVAQTENHGGMLSRAWRMLTSVFKK